MRTYALECARVRMHLAFDLREPITQSAYDQLKLASRAELIPVRECAQLLAERNDWTEGDLVECDGERLPNDTACERIIRSTMARLRSLVDEGTLIGRGKGARLKITSGSFYDWLGEPVPVASNWGSDFEIYGDDQTEEATGLTKRRVDVLELVDRLAAQSELPFYLEHPDSTDAPAEGMVGEEVQRVLALRIRSEVQEHWIQFLTCEHAIDEMTEEFGGEDVLLPDVREVFNDAKAALLGLHERIQRFSGPFELPDEPDTEMLAFIKRMVDREVPR